MIIGVDERSRLRATKSALEATKSAFLAWMSGLRAWRSDDELFVEAMMSAAVIGVDERSEGDEECFPGIG